MKKDIKVIKDEVQDEIYTAFNKYCADRVKQLRADLAHRQERLDQASQAVKKTSDDLYNLTTDGLWEDFFKYEIMTQDSAYQRHLTGK